MLLSFQNTVLVAQVEAQSKEVNIKFLLWMCAVNVKSLEVGISALPIHLFLLLDSVCVSVGVGFVSSLKFIACMQM